MKYIEIRLKYQEARIKALRSSLLKKGTTLDAEMMKALQQIYKKYVRPDVREFIEELENEEQIVANKPKIAKNSSSSKSTD